MSGMELNNGTDSSEAEQAVSRANYLAYEIDHLRDEKLLSAEDKRAQASALQKELRALLTDLDSE